MKMLARVRGVALIVLAAAMGVVIFNDIFEPVRGQDYMLPQLYQNQYITTADVKFVEQESCVEFGSDVIAELKADEKTRDVFFAEVSDFLTKKFTIEILDVKISDENKICILYLEPAQKKPPYIHQKRLLTRFA